MPTSPSAALALDFREFVLDNGLRIVVHEDHSDPVVAVHVSYHVGSAREELGRSGLAHLFEHLMFEGSEHVAPGEHFRLIQAAGGSLNGATSFDRTWYYEVLPAHQLELALWLEADRMGALLPALSREKLDLQRDVVKNEKRQSYDNRPYGKVREALNAALYPSGHPYSWIPIGSMADLDAASLDDVRAFFQRWYGPNNAVLVIAGDVESERALELAQRHFGGIPRGPDVGRPASQPIALERDRQVVLEDRVQLPQLTFAWPTAVAYSRDDAALVLATMILSQNKSAVLDRALTVERLLARSVAAGNEGQEIAGHLLVQVTAAPGTSLAEIEDVVCERIEHVASRGVDPEHLARMQSRAEADHIWHLETVDGKAATLSEYAVMNGDPGYGAVELARLLAVRADEVQDVVRRYLAGKPAALVAVVPEGKRELAPPARAAAPSTVRPAPTTLPEPAPVPRFHLPAVWHSELFGLGARGVVERELPVTALHLALGGGRLYEPRELAGLAALTSGLLQEGTRKLSTVELQDRLDSLGASLSVRAADEELYVSFSVLDKHLADGLALLEEVLFEPRFASEDFERLRKQALIAVDTRADQIRIVAANAWSRILYGDASALGTPTIGTRTTLERIALEDVRSFHAGALARRARMVLAAGFGTDGARERFSALAERLARTRDPSLAPLALPEPRLRAGREVFLIDKPGAAQSEIRAGHLGVAATDPDFFPLAVLNYVLGGAFTSRLNQNLREKRGFTYGAHSGFDGDRWPGSLTVQTAVHTEVTAAAAVEIVRELEAIRAGVTEEELALAQQALSQSLLRQFEPVGARLSMLDNSSRFGWPDDYPARRLAELERLTPADLRALAARRVHPERLSLLVVGDRARIARELEALGEVIELDIDGERVGAAVGL